MTARGTEIIFRCLDCLRVWPERRTTRMVGPECAPSAGYPAMFVRAICRARDVTSLVSVTLQGVRHFTGADRVALDLPGAACYYQDGDAVLSCVPRSGASIDSLACEPMLIADVTGTEQGCATCRLPDARSMAVVPVCRRKGTAVLRAFWRDPRAARMWHLETMQLLADAVGLRLDSAHPVPSEAP